MAVLALQAFLDAKSEERIRELWEKLQAEDIWYTKDPNVRPHITFGSWEVEEVTEEFCSTFKSVCAQTAPQEVFLLPAVSPGEESGLYLEPRLTRELMDYHARIHEKLGNPGEYYRNGDIPDTWVPHLTLGGGMKTDQYGYVVRAFAEVKPSHESTIEYLGLVTFGPIEYPAVCKLTGEQ